MSQENINSPLLGDQQSETEHRRRNYGSSASLESTNSQRRNNNRDLSSSDDQRSTLSFFQKVGFGLGHVYNDLCAGVWFSYTLLFMQAALLLPAVEAGALVMIGQVGDALATPIIGLLTDRFGTKRQWHIAGTILVFLSFPMIFSLCPYCSTAPKWWPALYFGIFIILFQFAWACVQITHFALISEMSLTQKDRSDLTSVRYAGSVCSSVIVYVITWCMLRSHSGKTNGDNIGPNDAFRFRDISLILTLIGTTMTVLFHFSLALSGYEKRRLCSSNLIAEENQDVNTDVNRRKSVNESSSTITVGENSGEDDNVISPSTSQADPSKLRKPPLVRINFFKTKALYQNGFLYVFARLFMTTSMIYLPLWLDERAWDPTNSTDIGPFLPTGNSTIKINDLNNGFLTPMTPVLFTIKDIVNKIGVEHLATVPLASFLSSFLTSVILKQYNNQLGNRLSFLIGSVIGLGACIWIALAHSTDITPYMLYSVAMLFGAGSSITMISSICIIAEMIGRHVYQGGFIYSVVTFADKFITGIVIVIIESLKCKDRTQCPQYYKSILAYGCGLAAVLGMVVLLTTVCNGKRRNQLSNQNDESSNLVI
ncbi:major facilitator superfamily domain-containing protein 12-like [Condylostylus longicornis]|uniref:major facilitator superfamily domain-containing protein 12-like n=1 Tax=Condylostylus longicornis TaxID=2530218 RepID=UPI00244E48FC|nr:major facilitator superfamily domain-containing protein 12-like [Condylostylus longicornis]XP_055389355.1 major facilitator superfamily domain-containing protein 12-like [Condylostylus longicornis]